MIMRVCITPAQKTLTICGIVLRFQGLVNAVSTRSIRTKVAPTVGIISIWPTKAEVVRAYIGRRAAALHP
ncbi:MAG: hypothetical protein K8F29_09345, partial [Kofleriaceae bacterium]|nr:hypothetical protein [Candidatus Methylomirabilis lanthanidiphila]